MRTAATAAAAGGGKEGICSLSVSFKAAFCSRSSSVISWIVASYARQGESHEHVSRAGLRLNGSAQSFCREAVQTFAPGTWALGISTPWASHAHTLASAHLGASADMQRQTPTPTPASNSHTARSAARLWFGVTCACVSEFRKGRRMLIPSAHARASQKFITQKLISNFGRPDAKWECR